MVLLKTARKQDIIIKYVIFEHTPWLAITCVTQTYHLRWQSTRVSPAKEGVCKSKNPGIWMY